mmetsp:Transcript_16411/g.17150  ORF Transcript_16411/g.17150 Transcript_16411/m.17150 type:complete len:281 (-) Transcript_16411:174-1016(-)
MNKAITLSLLLTSTNCLIRNELILQDENEVGEVILTKRPHEYIKINELPENFDYRSDGLLTSDLNQHIPVYCGSCWAHGTISSIADRIKIATKGKMRDIIPSVQALINCGHAGSCNGGDANAANAWIYKNGIPDVTCQQYQAKNMECSAINTCMNCDYGGTPCYAITNYPKIQVSEYGTAYGDDQIMAEIYARGPVAAYIDANCIETYSGGINMYDTCTGITNHAIALTGWGTENGTDYWIGRNSWGTYWGEHGFFRIVRGGKYQPKRGFWAVPVVPDWL